ncbi:MAG: hypothetical protein EA360_06360 [Balneolaceae bacterium]|nr:MAG: hypothetical protein EA360_06360 [Balneolaceae bacterium]
MKQMMNQMVWAGLYSALAASIFVLMFTGVQAQQPGLLPQHSEGFETGDWRNFRPHYIGDSSEWIRPNFTINETDPISGNYSLQWKGDGEEHEWLKLSNAFYTGLPVTVSIDIRVEAVHAEWSAGLRLLETFGRYTGVRLASREDGLLDLYLEDLSGQKKVIDAKTGSVLRVTISRSGNDEVSAVIEEKESGTTIAKLNGYSSVVPEAIGIYVKTGHESDAIINFDNVHVEAAPYRMRSGKWTRSPQFVILPRLPEITQDQGNWVGGQSTMKKGDRYLMWYRMRDNIDRGRGYGFAESSDGLHWKKYENPPVFTYDPDLYSSSEKISVLYVDGLYRAWYAVNAPHAWYTAYATSEDGINWEKHGLVIDEASTKDAVVIYTGGTYYLYAIRDNVNVGIHTSQDGIEWQHRNTIPMGAHRHVAAVYVERTSRFHLYITGGFAGVSEAVSADGVNFGPFRQVMEPSKAGLDDWQDAGVTYLSFLTDEYGKIDDDRQMPVYYQARNTWNNNIPGWLYHGGERVVLAGHYSGIFPGVKTTILPTGEYEYHSFPFGIPLAEGLEITASQESVLMLDNWKRDGNIVAEGSVVIQPVYSGHSGLIKTQVQWEMKELLPDTHYGLEIDGEQVLTQQSDSNGNLLLTTVLGDGETEVRFTIARILLTRE